MVRLQKHCVRAVILSLGLVGWSAQAADAQLDHNQIYDSSRLLEVDITVDEGDWKKLCRQSRGFSSGFANPSKKIFTFFKADVVINGVRIESVGLRKKGFLGSLDDFRPSLKIKFDEYVDQHPIAGLDRLTLNNSKQDPSVMSLPMGFNFFRDAGLPASRCTLAKVTVNGESLGIYANVEAVRRDFLKEHFGNADGRLYEGTLTDFYPKTIPRLEAKSEKADTNREKASRLAKLLAAEGPLDLAAVEELVDVDQFLRFWAVESLIGFWDGYCSNQNNFFAYENAVDGKFHFMPWGVDSAFVSRSPFSRFSAATSPSVYAQALLPHRLYKAPGIADRYRKTLEDLLKTVWNEERLLAEIGRLEGLIGDGRHSRQRGGSNTLEGVRKFVTGRRELMDKALAEWPATIPSEPRTPMYTVDVGTIAGSFSTEWQDEATQDVAGKGKLELNIVLDEKPVEVTTIGAVAQPGRSFRRRRTAPGEGPASLVLSAKRTSDSETLTLYLTLSREDFLAYADGKPHPVEGFFLQGTGGNAFRRRPLTAIGQIQLSKSGLKPGAPVAGSVELKVSETRGGLFGARTRRPSRNTPNRRPNDSE